MTAPTPGTPEYQWWETGCLDEAEARQQKLRAMREGARRLVNLAEAYADQQHDVGDVLERLIRVYAHTLTRDQRRHARRALRPHNRLAGWLRGRRARR